MMVLHAPNVHSGGGLTLLRSLLYVLPEGSYLILDERLPLPEASYGSFQIKRVKPTLWGRFSAELFLRRHVHRGDRVFCFGNLPPMFGLRGEVRLFLQNRYLVEDVPLHGFPLRTRVRIAMERLWLNWYRGNVGKIIVQTPSMQRLVRKKLAMDAKILALVPDDKLLPGDVGKDSVHHKAYDFVYVSSGEPHKNHRNLVKAWILLSQNNIRPALALTLDTGRYATLVSWIEKKKAEFGLNIINLGVLSGDEVDDLYHESRALVFPSTFESFGIPLIEARNAGLSIVASELDYVRDLVDPDEGFDPSSAVSIARAVQRSLGEEEMRLPLLDAERFLQNLFGD